MVGLNIEMPESFFQAEERDGYWVSVEKKELWAVQLDLLKELDRVCRKHNLKYTIDFGTLLGAVRHKGFIPWDIDVDVSFLREDYDKLMEIGPKEFKEPYFFQNQETDKNYNVPIARLRRSDTTFFHLGYSLYQTKYNQGIFVDLFPFDNLPSNDPKEVEEVIHKCSILHHRANVVARVPSRKMGYWYPFALLKYLYYRCRFGNYKKGFNRLYDYSKSFAYSGYVAPLVAGYDFCRPIHWFDEATELPLENFSFRALSAYDDVLKEAYGDYMTPVINTRRIFYYNASRSYKESLADPTLSETHSIHGIGGVLSYLFSCVKSVLHLSSSVVE